jgi:NAD(P)H-hydrate epimerase
MIYKNAAPVIVSPDKSAPIICFSGTNSLSRAGSGDLLAGIMAAHLAIGCSMSFAAARSYTLLSRAACIAAQDVGEDAVIASDILSRLGIAGRM